MTEAQVYRAPLTELSLKNVDQCTQKARSSSPTAHPVKRKHHGPEGAEKQPGPATGHLRGAQRWPPAPRLCPSPQAARTPAGCAFLKDPATWVSILGWLSSGGGDVRVLLNVSRRVCNTAVRQEAAPGLPCTQSSLL